MKSHRAFKGSGLQHVLAETFELLNQLCFGTAAWCELFELTVHAHTSFSSFRGTSNKVKHAHTCEGKHELLSK